MLDPGLVFGVADKPMSSDLAAAIGWGAGFLALAVWLMWPTKHRCAAGERCPHHDRDYDIPL